MCNNKPSDSLNDCEKLQRNFDELQKKYKKLKGKYSKLETKLETKSNQVEKLFSKKSEKRQIELTNQELAKLSRDLAEFKARNKSPQIPEKTNKPKTNKKDKYTYIGNLRIDLSKVEIVTEDTPIAEITGLTEDEYEVLNRIEVTRLCASPSRYYLRKLFKYKLKLKSGNNEILTTDPLKGEVFDKGFIDNSFLAELVTEKFLYHLPLYRQHQRLLNSGIKIDRGYLSKLVFKVAELLKPVHKAQMNSILESKVLMVDETKLRVGIKKKKMKLCYLVPLLGDSGEISFVYSEDRKLENLDPLLAKFADNQHDNPVLLTDGYAYYANFASNSEVTHALCWSHTRRKFLDAEKTYPDIVKAILDEIAKLYLVEKHIKELSNQDKLKARTKKSKPIVDYIFNYLQKIRETETLLPSSYLRKAMEYAQHREQELRVYLSNPEVNIDTNPIERQIRPIAIGRKNYMFCMKEDGASVAAICYSLIRSCILQEINPSEYLKDVLGRLDSHPASRVHELTPRYWKEALVGN